MNFKVTLLISFFVFQTLAGICQNDSSGAVPVLVKIQKTDSAAIDDETSREADSVNAWIFYKMSISVDTIKPVAIVISTMEDTANEEDILHFNSRFSLSLNICPIANTFYIKTDSLQLIGIGNHSGYFRNTAGMPSGLSLQYQLKDKTYLQAGCSLFQNEITLRDKKIKRSDNLVDKVIYDGRVVVKYRFNTFQVPLSVSHYSTEYDHSLYYSMGIKANFIYNENMDYESETNLYYVAGQKDPFYNTTRLSRTNKTVRLYNITPTVSIGGCYTPTSRVSFLYYFTLDGFPVYRNKNTFFNLSYIQCAAENFSFIYYF